MNLHPLLKRQLKRVGIDPDADDTRAPAWRLLLERVSRAYEEHDQEAYLLERSQDLASQEMATLYATVRADRDLLESRVNERTEALRLSEGRLESLLSLSADWIWEQDAELRFTYVSDSFEGATGFAPALLIGTRLKVKQAQDGGPEADAAQLEHKAAIDQRKPFRDFDHDFVRPDGARRYVRISGEPVFSATGEFQGYRGVGRDMTQDRLAEQKVQELARFDSLTALPNRNTFLHELDRAMSRGRRRHAPFAVYFIDLDRFKTINDTLGHSAGDEMLVTMAARLRGAVRESDQVARLGGDEFVVLLEGNAEVAALTTIAEKLLVAIGEPMMIQGHRFLVTGSIGIAMFPTDGQDSATLLKHADAAMYLAKEKGKNNVQFYTAELAELAAQQFALESALQLALANEELLLHYQPKVCIGSGRMIGMEALLRWQHPVRGLVPPLEFIPLAEERGLILPIGRWAIQAACRQIQLWRAQGHQVPPVAVNLSARQFASDTLVDDVTAAMAEHGVAPADLEVELTESVLMADPERANHVLRQLHALGVRIAIDDFGTGYSSLSYLKRFPAQTVKIDRSFIKGLPTDADDLAITEAVMAMAHSLGLNVVAEGVETAEQLEALRRLGCDEAQGYFLGRPMAAASLEQRLEPVSEAMTGPA